MNRQIHDLINRIEAAGMKNVQLLALITDSSYEVIFYAGYNGKMRQSNDLAESGVLSLGFVDEVYTAVADAVREDDKFHPAQMNIVKVSGKNITTEYDDKSCSVYSWKKNWKESLGL